MMVILADSNDYNDAVTANSLGIIYGRGPQKTSVSSIRSSIYFIKWAGLFMHHSILTWYWILDHIIIIFFMRFVGTSWNACRLLLIIRLTKTSFQNKNVTVLQFFVPGNIIALYLWLVISFCVWLYVNWNWVPWNWLLMDVVMAVSWNINDLLLWSVLTEKESASNYFLTA